MDDDPTDPSDQGDVLQDAESTLQEIPAMPAVESQVLRLRVISPDGEEIWLDGISVS
jgi:hypothetical protein